MNTKTKPLTGRIKDIVSRHLANRIHLDPVEIQGLLRFKKNLPQYWRTGADQEPYRENRYNHPTQVKLYHFPGENTSTGHFYAQIP